MSQTAIIQPALEKVPTAESQDVRLKSTLPPVASLPSTEENLEDKLVAPYSSLVLSEKDFLTCVESAQRMKYEREKKSLAQVTAELARMDLQPAGSTYSGALFLKVISRFGMEINDGIRALRMLQPTPNQQLEDVVAVSAKPSFKAIIGAYNAALYEAISKAYAPETVKCSISRDKNFYYGTSSVYEQEYDGSLGIYRQRGTLRFWLESEKEEVKKNLFGLKRTKRVAVYKPLATIIFELHYSKLAETMERSKPEEFKTGTIEDANVTILSEDKTFLPICQTALNNMAARFAFLQQSVAYNYTIPAEINAYHKP